jgi:pimeloyl-ACP methyl ester carboxylesterase
MSLEQLVSDARELIADLRERFGAERVFVQAGSFGTSFGAMLAARPRSFCTPISPVLRS